MISLVIVLLIFVLFSVVVISCSILLIFYVNIGNLKLAIASIYLAINYSLPKRKKEFVLDVRKALTEDFYIQLSKIMEKSDDELEKLSNVNRKKNSNLKQEIAKILNDRPEFLISEEQAIILLKATNSWSFFSNCKYSIETAKNYYDQHRKLYADDLKSEQLKDGKLAEAIAGLHSNEKDLIKSLLI